MADEWDEIAKRYGVPLAKPKSGNASADIDVSDLLDKMQGGTFQQESGGNYQVKRNARTGAVGGFQVMPANIPVWTSQYVGKQMTPDEFERDPVAQDKVFRGEMGKYLKRARARGVDDRTAIRMAAAQWYGGEGAIDKYDNPNRFRPNEPSFQEYTNSVADRSLKAKPTPKVPSIDFDALNAKYGIGVESTPEINFDDLSSRYEIAPPVKPVTEKPETIDAQIQASLDPNVKTRFGVLTTDPSQNAMFGNRTEFTAIPTKEGTLWLNTKKIFSNKKLKLRNLADLRQYVEKNPNALTTLLGIAENVGNNTQGTADVVKARKDEVDLLAPTSPTGEADDPDEQGLLQARFAEARKADPTLTVEKFNQILRDEAEQKFLANNADYAEFLKQTGLPNTPESQKEYNLAQQASVAGANKQNRIDVEAYNKALPRQPQKQMQGQAQIETKVPDNAPRVRVTDKIEINPNEVPEANADAYISYKVAERLAQQQGVDPSIIPDFIKAKGGTLLEGEPFSPEEIANLKNKSLNLKVNFQPGLGDDLRIFASQLKDVKDAQQTEASLTQKMKDEALASVKNPDGTLNPFDPNAWTLAFEKLITDPSNTTVSEDDLKRVVEANVEESIKQAGSATEAQRLREEGNKLSNLDKASRFAGSIAKTILKSPASFAKTIAWAEDTVDYLKSKGAIIPTLTSSDLLNGVDWVISKTFGLPEKEKTKAGTLPMMYAKAVEDLFKDDPVTAQLASTKFANAIGSAVPFLVGATLSGGSTVAVAALGIGMQVGEMYDEAQRDGLSREKQLLSGALGIPIGASEVAGLNFGRLGALLNKKSGGTFGKYFLKWLLETGKEATEETIQEFLQSTAGDLVKTGMLKNGLTRQDVAKALGQSTGDAVTGGIVGALFGGGVPIAASTAGALTAPNTKARTDALLKTEPEPVKTVVEPEVPVEAPKAKKTVEPKVEPKVEPAEETPVEIKAEAPVEIKEAPRFKDGKREKVEKIDKQKYDTLDFEDEIPSQVETKPLVQDQPTEVPVESKTEVNQSKALRELGYTLPMQKKLSEAEKQEIVDKGIRRQDAEKKVETTESSNADIMDNGTQSATDSLPEPIKNTKKISEHFNNLVKGMDRDAVEELLYDWDEAGLNEDGDRLVRIGDFSRGDPKGVGTTSRLSKGEFINWLNSEAPFDETKYGKNIRNNKEYVDRINQARIASGLTKESLVSTAPTQPPIAEGVKSEVGNETDFVTKPQPVESKEKVNAIIYKVGDTVTTPNGKVKGTVESVKGDTLGVAWENAPVEGDITETTADKVKPVGESTTKKSTKPEMLTQTIGGMTRRGYLIDDPKLGKRVQIVKDNGELGGTTKYVDSWKPVDQPMRQAITEDIYEQAKDDAGRIKRGDLKTRRFDTEVERGRIAGGQRNVEASLILAADARASEKANASRGTGVDSISDTVRRQENILENYAKRNDIWFKQGHFPDRLYIDKGGEAIVYRKDENRVVKLIDPRQIDKSLTPQAFLDTRVTLFNYLFPESRYEVMGFMRDDNGKFRVIVTQPFIQGEPIKNQSDVDAFMKGRGLTRSGRQSYSNKLYEVHDLHEKNVIKGNDGTIYVLDAVPKLVNKDLYPALTVEPVDQPMAQAVGEESQPFYSQLERTIEQKMPAKASANQVRGIIKDTKQEEREWLGVDEWLGDRTVTKDEVLEFIRENQVKVEEVVKASDSFTLEDAENEAWEKLQKGQIYALEDGAYIERTGSGGWFELRHDGRGRKFSDLEGALDTAVQEGLLNVTEKSETKFSQYVLPGGENYKELLLTMPAKAMSFEEYSAEYKRRSPNIDDATIQERYADYAQHPGDDLAKSTYKSSHFDEPNILAHIRFDDRTVDGKKVLHIAEIQSDWHQAGRKKGYAVDNSKELEALHKRHEELIKEAKPWTDKDQDAPPNMVEEFARVSNRINELERKVDTVPNAPFKKSWQELAFKKALRYAVENGYDAVSWDTGETQAERYDLSKQVDKIEVEVPTETNGDVRFVDITPTSGDKINLEIEDGKVRDGGSEPSLVGKPLEDVVGKEMAEKILAVPVEDSFATFEGNDLKVGGEGMKGFYDKILPNFVDKYTKKWGGKVELAVIGRERDLSLKGREGESAIDALNRQSNEWKSISAHSLNITPEMRESVMEGQPLFQKDALKRAITKVDKASFENAKTIPARQLIQDVDFNKNARVVEDGVVAVDEIREVELIRRLINEANGTRGGAFYGVFNSKKLTRKFLDTLTKKIKSANEKGIDTKQLKTLKMLVTNASKQDGTVIFAMDEEALTHEKVHRALNRYQTGTSKIAPDVQDAITNSAIFKKVSEGKWGRAYANANPANKVEEFITAASTLDWDALGIKSEADKRAAMSNVIDYYNSYAETNKGEGTAEEVLNALATEIAYVKEITNQDQKVQADEGTASEADGDSSIKDAERKEDRPDVKTEGKPDELAGKLKSREPGKSGLAFDEAEAEKAREAEMKVAAMSRAFGSEMYYVPVGMEETAATARQMIDDRGMQSIIQEALTGQPSAAGKLAVYWEMQRLSTQADMFKEDGREAEANVILNQLSDLAAALAVREQEMGREINISKWLPALSPEAAIMTAEKMVRKGFGDTSTISTDQTAKVKELAAELQKVRTQQARSESIIAEQQRIIDNLDDEKPARVLNRQEALLENYKKKEKIIRAELAKRFPDSPVFNGEQSMLMAVGENTPKEVIIDPETASLLKDYTIGQVLTNRTYNEVIAEIQAISGASTEQAKDIHSLAMDEIRGAKEPTSEEAKKRIQIRQEHYQEADKHSHPEKQAKKAIQLAEANLKRQIDTLEKEIASGQKEVKTKNKVTSPEIERLKRERDALKSTRDELLGEGSTDEQKIARAIKSTRRSIDRLTEKIQNNDTSVKTAEKLSNKELDNLKAERKTLQSILNDIRKEARKVAQAPKSQLTKIARQVAEKFPDDLELILAAQRLTGKDPKSINEVINYLQNTYGFHITEAKELAQQAWREVQKIKESNKQAKDAARGIIEEERKKLDQIRVDKNNATRALNRFLSQLAANPNVIKRFNDDFRAKLVSNWGTQIFNAVQSTTVTTPAQILLDMFEAQLRSLGLNIGESSDVRARDAWRAYQYIFANNRKLAEQALAHFPEQYFEVHSGLLGDIPIDPLKLADTKKGLAKLAHRWFDANAKLNEKLTHITGAKLQEMHFRNAIVASTFDAIIRKRTDGKSNLEKAMADGTFKDIITEKDAQRAAARALEVTFASQINDPIGRELKKMYDKLDNYLPVLLNPVTYARFTYTTTKVMVLNPLTFGLTDQLLDLKNKPEDRTPYNTRDIAKGVLAWGTVVIAYGLMSALGGDDDKWYTLYPLGKDGPVWDIRRTFPLSAFFYTAHVIKESGVEGKPLPSKSEMLAGFASLETDYFQYGPVLELLGEVKDYAVTKGEKGEVKDAAIRTLGNYLAGMTRFFKPFRDTLAQFDAEERAYRDDPKTAQDKFINELSRSIPGIIRLSDQEKQYDIEGNPLEQKFPLGRIFGVNIANPALAKNKDSAATAWANELFPFVATKKMTPEERKMANARSAIREAVRAGKKVNVDDALENMKVTLSKKSLLRLKDELKYSELGAKVKYAFGDNPEKVKALKTIWKYATDQEKQEIQKVLREKKDVSRETKNLFQK